VEVAYLYKFAVIKPPISQCISSGLAWCLIDVSYITDTRDYTVVTVIVIERR